MSRHNSVLAFVLSIVLPALALSACSPGSNTGTSTTAVPDRVVLGQEFSLAMAQTVSVAEEDLAIKFVEVVSDSRCPSGVTCIWAGEVSSLVEFNKGNTGANRVVLTQSGSTDQTVRQVLEKYLVAFRVDPYPAAGKQIDKSEYRLVMTVTKSVQSDLEIRPAPIHEVTVTIAKSKPPQMVVYIKGGLPDGCTTFNDLKTNRAGTTVTISVTNKRPKDAICPAVYGYFEQTVNLGSDFVPGQVYTIQVNDYVTTFQYPL